MKKIILIIYSLVFLNFSLANKNIIKVSGNEPKYCNFLQYKNCVFKDSKNLQDLKIERGNYKSQLYIQKCKQSGGDIGLNTFEEDGISNTCVKIYNNEKMKLDIDSKIIEKEIFSKYPLTFEENYPYLYKNKFWIIGAIILILGGISFGVYKFLRKGKK